MRWKAARRASLCLCACAGLTAAAAEFVARSSERQVFAAIADHAKALTADKIIADPWRGEIRLLGLTWREAGASIHVGALRLRAAPPALFPGVPAFADAHAASAEDVTIETALASFKIRRIELSGTSLSAVELAQILDSSSGAPISERIGRISAATIAIPELISVSKFTPFDQRFVYRNIRLTDVVRGKAAAASADGASFSMSDPELGDAEGAYGHMTSKAVDLILAARIMSGRRDDPAEPETPLCQSFAIEGFHLSNAKTGFDLGAGALTGDGVRGRPWRAPWIEAMGGEQIPLERKKRVAAIYADISDSLAVDEMDASDVRLTMRTADAPANLTIGHVAITQFHGAEIDAVNIQNLAFATEMQKIGFEGLAIRQLDLASLGRASAISASSDDDAAQRPFAEFVATRLDGEIADAKAGREGFHGAFKLGRLEVRESQEKDKDSAAIKFDAALDHFTLRLDEAKNGALKDLRALGYSQLDLSSRIAIVWDEARQELAITTLAFEGADMGSVRISGLLSNVAKNLFSTNHAAAIVAALDALLKKFDVRLVNAGLFDKVIAAQAERQHKSIDEMRQTYARAAIVFLPVLLENAPAAQTIGAALIKFIANPKSLRLVAAAPDGLSLSDLTAIQTPGALLNKLSVEASANE